MLGQNAHKELIPANSQGVVLTGTTGVFFDEDSLTLEGKYKDEISSYRAKKNWCETLKNYFLLETNIDFKISVQKASLSDFQVKLEFTSPCGRYAFWKLSTDQSHEAQYAIEVAHLPTPHNTRGDGLLVPEMKRKGAKPSETLWRDLGSAKESLLTKIAKKLVKRLIP